MIRYIPRYSTLIVGLEYKEGKFDNKLGLEVLKGLSLCMLKSVTKLSPV